MKEIASEQMVCRICGEYHEVPTVKVTDQEVFKGEEVEFQAIYLYCSNADEYLATEDMIRRNDRALKDAYRKKAGLLTSTEIRAIRDKYGISQKDLAAVLDWGRATIARYETHQVQDRAHDDILRTIDRDPKWFLDMLERARPHLPARAYDICVREAKVQYKGNQNRYLIDTIEAVYAKFDDPLLFGKVPLNLNKVVEMINCFAAQISSLHKVKLMKLLWYADALHYKRTGRAISGLVYLAMDMGAVPEAHRHLMLLDGVVVNEVEYGEHVGYRLKPVNGFAVKELTSSELAVLDDVIAEFGALNAQQISERMQAEEAYKHTPRGRPISFELARNLSID